MKSRTRFALVVLFPLLLAAGGCGPHSVAQRDGLRLEIRPARTAAFPGSTPARLARTGETLYLGREVLVSNRDIQAATVDSMDRGRGYAVFLRFTTAAAERLIDFTARREEQRLAVLVDGLLVMAPVVDPMMAEVVVLEANFTEAEARYFATAIAPRVASKL